MSAGEESARPRQGGLFGPLDPPAEETGRSPGRPEVAAASVGQDARQLAASLSPRLRFGTSSWAFPGWRGAVYAPDAPKGGCILVQGTMSTANVVEILPELDKRGLNVKLVSAGSPQLFAAQSADYQTRVYSEADRWDSTFISNRSRRLMYDWIKNPLAAEYAMTSDFDDRWRTGGTVDEVVEEAHLSPEWLLKGIERFVSQREQRLAYLRELLDATHPGA